MPFCSHCGARLEEAAAFCSECGAKVTRTTREEPPKTETKRPNRSPLFPPEDGFTFDLEAVDSAGKRPRPSYPEENEDRFSFDPNPLSSDPSSSYRSYLDDDLPFAPPSSSSGHFQDLDSPFIEDTYQQRQESFDASSSQEDSPFSPVSGGQPPVKWQSAQKNTSQTTGKKIGIIVLICVLVAAVVGVGIFFLTRKSATPEELYSEALLMMENGDYEGAAENLITVLSKNPKDVNAYLQLAQCYVHLDREERAAEILQAGYAQTRDSMITAALAELGTTPEEPASSESSTEPPASSESPPVSEESPASSESESSYQTPTGMDLASAFLGDFSNFQNSFGTLQDMEDNSDTYIDEDGNEIHREQITYTYDQVAVITQNGTITGVLANFNGDTNFHIMGIGKGATYSYTVGALGHPETAATEEGYDTLVYLSGNGRAVKFYFRNDVLALASIFLGSSQNG